MGNTNIKNDYTTILTKNNFQFLLFEFYFEKFKNKKKNN